MSDEERIARLCSFVASLPEPRRPPLVLPAELGVKVEDIFHHVEPALVPEIAHVLELLMERDPQTLAAVGDVDRSLIWQSFEEPPLERLAQSARQARAYERMKLRLQEKEEDGQAA